MRPESEVGSGEAEDRRSYSPLEKGAGGLISFPMAQSLLTNLLPIPKPQHLYSIFLNLIVQGLASDAELCGGGT